MDSKFDAAASDPTTGRRRWSEWRGSGDRADVGQARLDDIAEDGDFGRSVCARRLGLESGGATRNQYRPALHLAAAPVGRQPDWAQTCCADIRACKYGA